ncbi:MAG: F0F1 ATP synthase subunit B [Planctomycetota bacterium]
MSTIPLVLATAAEKSSLNLLDFSELSVFIWTVVIFVLALPVMWGMVFGPITDALHARDKRADDAISEASEAKDAAEKARLETEAALREAREEAKKQIREAKDLAEKQKAELVAQARTEAEAERARVRAEIVAEKAKAMDEIRDLVVDLSLGATSRLLEREVAGDDQRKLVKGFLSELDRQEVRS